MNERLQHLEIQRLLQEYNFLLLDDEYKQEVISSNKSEFLKKVNDLNGKSITESDSQSVDESNTSPQENKKQKIDPSTVDPKIREKVKKLYREIAKLTHPDKVDSNELVELYTKATVAAEEFDLFVLYSICAQLNISHSIDKEDKSVLKEHISNKKKKLDGIEKSFIWLYAHSETEEEKEKLVKLFIDQHSKKL
jgi:pyruvate/2-oxoglutarate dehydrogenase complex dihydrolipoamide acyltransferase (E2) component